MKSPFYTIYNHDNGRDFTRYVNSFRYEDCVKIDNMLFLDMDITGSMELIDDPDLQEGATLVFQFGYIGGKVSPQLKARITNCLPTYGVNVKLNIEAMDMGIVLKKSGKRVNVWEEMTTTEIIRDIATRHGLAMDLLNTTYRWPMQAQGNRNDFDFIRYLVEREEGDMHFYVRDKTVHLKKIDYGKSSYKTFRYNSNKGDLLSFNPKSEELYKETGSIETEVISIDPITNEPIVAKANDSNTSSKKLGTYSHHFNQNGEPIATAASGGADSKKTGDRVVMPAPSQKVAENAAIQAKRRSEKSNMTADAEIEGDPTCFSDQIITIAGVAKKHEGNWYIERVNHSISTNYYGCSLELTKDAGNIATGAASKASKAEKTEVNSSAGPNQADSSRKIKVTRFNQNAEPI